MPKMPKPETVDAYIASAPKDVRGKLQELRRAIRSVAPEAEERISYRMPYYAYKGRLAYFMLAKNHIGLYIPPPIVAQHANDLANYVTSKGTVRLPLTRKIPVALVRKLIRARVKWNDAGKRK